MKKVTYILTFSIVLSFVLSGCSKDTASETELAVVQEKNPDEPIDTVESTETKVVDPSETVVSEASSGSPAFTGVVTESGVYSTQNEVDKSIVAYKDGVYRKSGSYTSPAGDETIQVNLTLADNKISDLVVLAEATHDVSKKYQGLFVEGISKLVIGKAIDEVESYSQVSGASLTPKGFDEAIKLIKEEAAK